MILIIENNMGWTRSTKWDKRNANTVLVGNPKRIRTLGRVRNRWLDNIKMNLRIE
jgi:hypothetical protein